MSARSLALIAALLVCFPGSGRQAPGPAAQAGSSQQEHVRNSLVSLPTAGAGQSSPMSGATRASLHYPWLAGMRKEGVGLAIITF